MNKEEFELLFPLEAEITQDIIDQADITYLRKCIGALTLKKILKDHIPEYLLDTIFWYDTLGGIFEIGVDITTSTKIEMMEVREPTKVTFIIDNR